MRKLQSPKLSPSQFEPELVWTMRSVLDSAVDQIEILLFFAEKVLRKESLAGFSDAGLKLTLGGVQVGFSFFLDLHLMTTSGPTRVLLAEESKVGPGYALQAAATHGIVRRAICRTRSNITVALSEDF